MEQASSGRYNTRIRELPPTERPRERLRDHGAANLSTTELLALLLRTGSAQQSALGLATSLLARHGGLRGLARLSYAELLRERGLGAAKAAELQAVFQLAVRLRELVPEERPYVNSPQDVHTLLGDELSTLDQEHLRVILLNSRNQVMAVTEVYKGNVGSAVVRAAELFREAIRQNAPSVILVHNHPSGDPSPSPDDVAMTKTAAEAGRMLDIEVLDHVIIGEAPKRWSSLKQLGLGFVAPPAAPPRAAAP